MKSKQIVTIALLIFVVASFGYVAVKNMTSVDIAGTGGPIASYSDKTHHVAAFYFHRNVRCATCLKIEDYAGQAVENGFPDQLDNKLLVWKIINTDEPENAHFTDDYDLQAGAVIIAEFKDGKQVRWKNLKKVWELVNYKESFTDYVQKEIQEYLESVS